MSAQQSFDEATRFSRLLADALENGKNASGAALILAEATRANGFLGSEIGPTVHNMFWNTLGAVMEEVIDEIDPYYGCQTL